MTASAAEPPAGDDADALRRRIAALERELDDLKRSRGLGQLGHNLRQPLQALRLFLFALQSRIAGEHERGLLAKMDEALDSADRLLEEFADRADSATGS